MLPKLKLIRFKIKNFKIQVCLDLLLEVSKIIQLKILILLLLIILVMIQIQMNFKLKVIWIFKLHQMMVVILWQNLILLELIHLLRLLIKLLLSLLLMLISQILVLLGLNISWMNQYLFQLNQISNMNIEVEMIILMKWYLHLDFYLHLVQFKMFLKNFGLDMKISLLMKFILLVHHLVKMIYLDQR